MTPIPRNYPKKIEEDNTMQNQKQKDKQTNMLQPTRNQFLLWFKDVPQQKQTVFELKKRRRLYKLDKPQYHKYFRRANQKEIDNSIYIGIFNLKNKLYEQRFQDSPDTGIT